MNHGVADVDAARGRDAWYRLLGYKSQILKCPCDLDQVVVVVVVVMLSWLEMLGMRHNYAYTDGVIVMITKSPEFQYSSFFGRWVYAV